MLSGGDFSDGEGPYSTGGLSMEHGEGLLDPTSMDLNMLMGPVVEVGRAEEALEGGGLDGLFGGTRVGSEPASDFHMQLLQQQQHRLQQQQRQLLQQQQQLRLREHQLLLQQQQQYLQHHHLAVGTPLMDPTLSPPLGLHPEQLVPPLSMQPYPLFQQQQQQQQQQRQQLLALHQSLPDNIPSDLPLLTRRQPAWKSGGEKVPSLPSASPAHNAALARMERATSVKKKRPHVEAKISEEKPILLTPIPGSLSTSAEVQAEAEEKPLVVPGEARDKEGSVGSGIRFPLVPDGKAAAETRSNTTGAAAPSAQPLSAKAQMRLKEERRRKRLLRNRVSAQLARERKKSLIQDMEQRCAQLEGANALLEDQIQEVMEDNNHLRQIMRSKVKAGSAQAEAAYHSEEGKVDFKPEDVAALEAPC